MAQLVIAAAGAAIGSMAGPGALLWGMTGAQLGWMAGSMLGSTLAPKQRSAGPRLDELRVTGTEYGGGIAWIAGAPRVAGDLIWASDRREIADTQEVGKGGGAEYTSYTYEVDALYLLTDQPGCIVTRIWDNGKLIWTSLASSSDATLIAAEQASKWRRITFYGGADDQMPDPTYETAVTNAPAYTRRLTVFVEGMQLGNSGALPNLTFEVASIGDSNPNFVQRYSVTDTGRRFADLFGNGLGFPGIVSMQPAVRVALQHDSDNGVYVYTLTGELDGTSTRTTDEAYPGPQGGGVDGVPANFPIGIINGLPARAANHAIPLGTVAHIRVGVRAASAWDIGLLPDWADVLPSGRYLGDTMPCSDGEHLLVFTGAVDLTGGSAAQDQWHLIKKVGGSPSLIASGSIAVARSFRVRGNCSGASYSAGMLEDDLQHVWIARGSGDAELQMLKIEADGVLRQRMQMIGALAQGAFTFPSIWAEGGFCVVVSRASYQAFRRAGDVIGEVSLRSVVDSLCERATMPAGTYDASALAGITQPVRALAMTNGSARQALEILQSSHGFDAYVTDKLYFVPRGGAPVLTVDADDLAAGENDAGAEPFSLTVNADLEIPARIAVTYKNMQADQVSGVEHSDRGPTGQDSVQQLQLAIGLTPTEAKGVADAMVRDAYAARITSQISLPMGYTKITPTDVLQVPGTDGRLYRMRVTRRSDSGGIIALDVVGDDGAVVIEEMATSEEYTPQTSIEGPAATVLVLLDIPLLRDADDGLGVYVAARGTTGKWPGCVVYRSNDGGVTFTESVAEIAEPAVLGETTSVLADWTGGGVVDRGAGVLVDMGPGQLSSATMDQLQADGDINALMVGDELIRFTTATLQSAAPNIYRLTGLLRGQRGTEWATGTHAIGEAVVLLRARGLRRVPLRQADLSQPTYFKGVNRGEPVSDAASVSITPTSIGQMPLAPVDLRASRDTDGSLGLTWKRRTRYEAGFTGPAGIVVPLGETSERYDVEIMSGPRAVRSVAVTEPRFTYSASMQTADFGGLQGAVTARVYQLGANGRGRALTASAGGDAGASIVRTLTLGGTFTAGLTINVRAGSLLLTAYVVQGADADLAGAATSIAAAITAGSAGYTASAAGAAITVTGPSGVSYVLTSEVSGASSAEVNWYVQQAATATAGTRYSARISVGAYFAWGAGGLITAGTVLGFTIQVGGAQLPPVQYSVTYDQDAQTALTGLQYAFQGSAIDAAGYQLTGNIDGFGYHLRLTKRQAGRTDTVVVNRSTGQFFLVGSLSTLADQGSDPIAADRPQISDVTIYGAPQAGEVYRVELGPNNGYAYEVTTSPTNFDYTAGSGDTAADVAAGLAAAIDAATDYLAATSDRGLGGDVNTVRITGAIVAPFVGAYWSPRAFIQRAITTTIS